MRGTGLLFFYWQVASHDTIDNYAANSASEVSWGEMSAYRALVGCKTNTEALKALVGVYKTLYPEPKIVQGWRGDSIEVDWLYVLQENFDLARMLRWEHDELHVVDLLDAMGVDYD